MINTIILMGRLTAVPELKYTQNNIPVCSVTLAVERSYKTDGERIADFISVVAWKSTAEFVSRYFTKGSLMAVEGSLQVREYIKDDEKRKVYEVVADKVSFCGKEN